jgi:hypothetical protein
MQNVMKDLTVELGADRPGALGKALDAIAQAGINVEGFAEISGTLHVTTADAARSRKALEAGGFKVTGDQDVVVVEVSDRPGTAAQIFRQLGDANVNVNFAYVAANNRLAVGAANVAKATEIIARVGAVV